MSNSENYYFYLKQFSDARKNAGTAYQARVAALERYKGSEYHDTELKKAQATKAQEIRNAQNRFGPKLLEFVTKMATANRNRKLLPPTEEQLTLLNALKMRSNVTEDELRQAANTMSTSPLALDLLRELASEKGIVLHMPDEFKSNGYSIAQTEELLSSLRTATIDYVDSEYSSSSRRINNYRRDHFGGQSTLVERPAIENKAQAFYELLGLRDTELQAFYDAVDGENE